MPYKSKEDMPPQCPPSDVVSENKEPVYRFIEGDEITECDFLNHKEAKKPYPDHLLCEALAISLFDDEEAAYKKQKRIKSLKAMKLVKGKLKRECGVYKIDHTHHMNLWLFENVNMLKVFTER